MGLAHAVFDVLALSVLGVFLQVFAESSSSLQSLRIQKSGTTSEYAKKNEKEEWKKNKEFWKRQSEVLRLASVDLERSDKKRVVFKDKVRSEMPLEKLAAVHFVLEFTPGSRVASQVYYR